MASETRRGVGIIPASLLHVKSAINDILQGLPIQNYSCHVSVSHEITDEECADAVGRLFLVERSAIVESRFKMGDIFNAVLPGQVSKRRVAYVNKFGDKQYAKLRQYGWVARKWDPRKRNFTKSWSWHSENVPGRADRDRKSRQKHSVEFVSQEPYGSDVVVHLLVDGSLCQVKIPLSEFEFQVLRNRSLKESIR